MPRPGRCWTACASVCSSVKGGSASIVVLWWGLIKMWKCLAEQLARHVFRAARCPSCWVWPGSLLRGHGRNYSLFLNFHFTPMQFLPMGKVLTWSGWPPDQQPLRHLQSCGKCRISGSFPCFYLLSQGLWGGTHRSMFSRGPSVT